MLLKRFAASGAGKLFRVLRVVFAVLKCLVDALKGRQIKNRRKSYNLEYKSFCSQQTMSTNQWSLF